jgi:uncharacterized protein YjbI with pentapeptide repeats
MFEPAIKESNMTRDEISKILNLHAKWFRVEEGGVRANLSGANLYQANLSGANLYQANLSQANLSGANLSRANLSEANLSEANLSRANLSWANLSWANLSEANLYQANLSGANLSEANLSRADLSWANLSGADLSGATGLTEQPLHTKILPEDGAFIGWKKVHRLAGGWAILKVQILESAKRVSSVKGRKCRASAVLVLAAFRGADRLSAGERFVSQYDSDFFYSVGDIVQPRLPFNDTFLNDCESGIHFFITRQEAEQY